MKPRVSSTAPAATAATGAVAMGHGMLTATPSSKFANCAQPGPLALRALACCPAACGADAPADAEPRAVVGVGVNDCDAFVATVRIAEIVEVLGINGSVVL